MKAAKNSIKCERNALSTTKKLLKINIKNILPAKPNAPISQTSPERLKGTIQTYQMGNKELKWSLDNFKRKYLKHLCQLVLI